MRREIQQQMQTRKWWMREQAKNQKYFKYAPPLIGQHEYNELNRSKQKKNHREHLEIFILMQHLRWNKIDETNRKGVAECQPWTQPSYNYTSVDEAEEEVQQEGISEWCAACAVERCSAQGDGLLDAAAGSRLGAHCAERKLPDKRAWCTSPRMKF